jgi:spermidine synthase
MFCSDEPKILYKNKSKYNHILVTEEGSIRTLWACGIDAFGREPKNSDISPTSGKTRQTVIDFKNPHYPQLEYTRNALMALALCHKPEAILVLGLGGGYLPMALGKLSGNTIIDVIEIDRNVLKVAKKFFNFQTSEKCRLFVNDAYLFIKKTNREYNIIIMDAYIGGDVPKALKSINFLMAAKKKLTEGGVMALNLFTSDELYYTNMMNKISTVFKEQWLLPCKESGNTIILATDLKHSQKNLIKKMRQIRSQIYEPIP